MAVIEGGVSAVLAEVGAAAANPLHVTTKPTPYGVLGHYAVAVSTGTIAAGMAGGGHIFHARWTDATKLAIIYEIQLLLFRNITTAFAAGVYNFNLDVMRAWTVDGSGGTALTLTGDNNALRTSMGSSLFGAIRIATTAALGAGTSTADAQSIGATFGSVGTTPTIGAVYIPGPGITGTGGQGGQGVPLFSRDPGSEHPLVLAQNEGIAIRGTVPATGTWVAAVQMKWAEVTAY